MKSSLFYSNRFTFVNGPIIPIPTSLQPTSPPVATIKQPNTTQSPQSNSDMDVDFRGLYPSLQSVARTGLIFGVCWPVHIFQFEIFKWL